MENRKYEAVDIKLDELMEILKSGAIDNKIAITNEDIMELMQVAYPTVSKYLKMLEEQGRISRKLNYDKGNKVRRIITIKE